MNTKEFIESKESIQKLKKWIISIWGRKELGIDTICILTDAIILTGLPLLYDRLPKGIGRIITALVVTAVMIVITVWTIIRLVRRNKERKLEKMDYLFLVLRSVVVAAAIWIFACIMVSLIHPSLTGIYAVEMTKTEQLRVTIFNSFFFVFCSQSILAIFTGTVEKNKEFFKRLVKTWAIAVIPMFLLTLTFTLLTDWVRGQDLFAANGLAILLTTFLWVTSIAIHERIKRGK